MPHLSFAQTWKNIRKMRFIPTKLRIFCGRIPLTIPTILFNLTFFFCRRCVGLSTFFCDAHKVAASVSHLPKLPLLQQKYPPRLRCVQNVCVDQTQTHARKRKLFGQQTNNTPVCAWSWGVQVYDYLFAGYIRLVRSISRSLGSYVPNRTDTEAAARRIAQSKPVAPARYRHETVGGAIWGVFSTIDHHGHTGPERCDNQKIEHKTCRWAEERVRVVL